MGSSPLRHPVVMPGSVLFACTHNRVRSPMAEAIAKHYLGRRVFVDSVGVRIENAEPDPFSAAVLEEMGLDLSRHKPKTFDDLEDASFDLVISLTPEAQHQAVELTRYNACDIEYWPTYDPSLSEGNRENRLAVYRQVRDQLAARIRERFDIAPPAQL